MLKIYYTSSKFRYQLLSDKFIFFKTISCKNVTAHLSHTKNSCSISKLNGCLKNFEVLLDILLLYG